MFQRFHHRAGHYALLTVISAALFLVNLGGPSLWDIDEGNNAEAAREMMANGNPVVPKFNFELRTDKPALLYWLQIGAYHLFDVNEFAARLPSALAALLTIILVYEFGRLLFGPTAGLLAGLILASAALFCASAHFANPDALLLLFSTLTLFLFWHGFARSHRAWFLLTGFSSGLAVLAKGPVGLVLPLGVIGSFLLWSGQWRLLLDRRLGWGVAAFLATAVPWYAWVAAETKGEFLRGFFLTHNYSRFVSTMENHSGGVYYYPLVILVGFAPWSIFLGPIAWYAGKALRSDSAQPNSSALPLATTDVRNPFRFLCCWIGVYIIFFSLSSTKLPNYVLPLYPPLAILTANFLQRWLANEIQPAGWVIKLCLSCLALMGIGVALGLLIAGGQISVPALKGRVFPGLELGAVLGLIPLIAAGFAWWDYRTRNHAKLVTTMTFGAILFVGSLAAWGGSVLNDYKAPRDLGEDIALHQQEKEIRIACYQYYQPSLVFYCRRQVHRLEQEGQVLDFLASPHRAYVLMPSKNWDGLQTKITQPHEVIGKHYDFYRNCDVVVVTRK